MWSCGGVLGFNSIGAPDELLPRSCFVDVVVEHEGLYEYMSKWKWLSVTCKPSWSTARTSCLLRGRAAWSLWNTKVYASICYVRQIKPARNNQNQVPELRRAKAIGTRRVACDLLDHG